MTTADTRTTTPADTAPGVRTELRGAVLWLTLERPERLNALDHAMAELLCAGITQAHEDPAVRAVVITGAGRAFSTGAQLASGPQEQIAADGDALLEALNRLVLAIQSVPVPVIAAVNGPTAGVAVPLAIACDLTIASEDAYFTMPFLGIGLMPDGGATDLIARAVGPARAAAMIYGGERTSAATAAHWGLIGEVCRSEDFPGRVDAAASRLATAAPQALAHTKLALNAAFRDGLTAAMSREAQGQSALLRGPEFLEGVTAFLQRRPADFASLPA